VNKKADFFEKRACSDLGDIPGKHPDLSVQSAALQLPSHPGVLVQQDGTFSGSHVI
jgi:hypothetical protein